MTRMTNAASCFFHFIFKKALYPGCLLAEAEWNKESANTIVLEVDDLWESSNSLLGESILSLNMIRIDLLSEF